MTLYQGFHIREGLHGQQDREVIEEVFVTDCYGIDSLTCQTERPLLVDIGAHIGAFGKKAAFRFPGAQVVSVEACAENIPLLRQNAMGPVLHAACYYTTERVGLLNSVFPGGKATGGSIVKTLSALDKDTPDPAEYRKDTRLLCALTLETISDSRFIDLLKLDCEGGEMNILAHADLNLIGTIVGEYHEGERWEALRAARFPKWRYAVLDSFEEAGRFRLENPERCSIHA